MSAIRTGARSVRPNGPSSIIARIARGLRRFNRGVDCIEQATASVCESLERRVFMDGTQMAKFSWSWVQGETDSSAGTWSGSPVDKKMRDENNDVVDMDPYDKYINGDATLTLNSSDLATLGQGEYEFNATILLINAGSTAPDYKTGTYEIDVLSQDQTGEEVHTVQAGDIAGCLQGEEIDQSEPLLEEGTGSDFATTDSWLSVSIKFPNFGTNSVTIQVKTFGLQPWTFAGQTGPTPSSGVDDASVSGAEVDCGCGGNGATSGGVDLETRSNDPLAPGVGSSADGYSLATDVEWSNVPAVTLAGSTTLGNNIISPARSFLMQDGPRAVLAVQGNSEHRFTANGSSYSSRNGVTDTLSHDNTAHTFTITAGDGTKTTYYDFSTNWASTLLGKIKNVIGAAGDSSTTTINYSYDSGHSYRLSTITRDTTDASSNTVHEQFAYAYLSSGANSGKVDTVTLQRAVNAGSYSAWRKTQYKYYDGSSAAPTNAASVAYGNSGDLMSVQNFDATNTNAAAIDTTYFRYFTPSGSGTNGYTGGLEYVVRSQSYARLVAAGSNPLTAAVSDATIASYADDAYQYSPTTHKVTQHVVQGEGSSGFGTHNFTSAWNHGTNTISMGDGHGAQWTHRTDETLPDGTTNRVYFDASGLPILNIKIDSSGHQWGTYKMFDVQGHLLATFNPSTLSLPNQSTLESYPDLLNFQNGRSPYINDAAGRVDFTAYYYATDSTINDTDTPGGVAGYLFQTAVGRGELSLPVTVSSITRGGTGNLTATVTTAVAHGYANGDSVTITGASVSAFNGTFTISNVTSTTFKYTLASDPGSNPSGTMTAAEPKTLLSSTNYFKHGDGSGAYVYNVATETRYRNADGTGAETTTHAYTWFADSLQVESETVDLPTISSAQNGPDSADETVTFYDKYGRPIWTKDGDGFINYVQYDAKTGAVAKRITDVDTANTSDFQDLPSGWSTSGSGGLHLITTYLVDGDGRATKVTDPLGNVTFTVYNDSSQEVRTYNGTMSGTNFVAVGPTYVHRTDRAGSYAEDLTLTTSPHLTGGVPDGTETITAGGIATLSRAHTNAGNQVDKSDSYLALTSGTNSATYSQGASSFQLGGTAGVNLYFYETTYGYDSAGRRNRVVNSLGTINRTIYDAMGRPTSSWIGTNDTPVSGAWSATNAAGMVDMADLYYDAHDGTQGVGDGNLARVVQHTDQFHADRNVEFFYDWRGRMVADKDGLKLTSGAIDTANEDTGTHRIITYNTYDNLNEVTQSDTYAADQVGVTTSNGVPVTPSSSKLRARVTYDYDDQGRRYRSTLASVDSSGNVGGETLTSNTFYDHRGNAIEIASPDAPVIKRLHDGANRVVKEYHTDGGSGTDWTAAGTVSSDQVMSQAEYTYDGAGNVILLTTRRHFHDDTTAGELGDASTGPLARVSFQAFWYDKANRLTDSVDVGTNGGTSYARDPAPPGATNRSDTLLLTHQDYNSAGWADTVTDARAIVAKSVYDMLGRTRRTVSAWDGNTNAISLTASLGSVAGSASNQITDYTYDGSNHTLTQTAWNKSGTNTATSQTTQYVYGVNTGQNGNYVNSNDLLYQVRYPDASTGGASTNAASVVTYGYNKQADAIRKTDQNGTLFIYSYDVLGRNSDAGQVDVSATVASGNPQNVDTAVVELATYYDDAGRAYLFTSYNGSSVVQNQVERLFNGFGQLVTEYQEHSGGVTGGSSLKVQYVYDQTNGHSRLSQVIYPNGRILHYGYNSGTDDAVSRVSFLADDDGSGDVGTHLEDYSYLGEDTIVIAAHGETGVDLTYVKQSGESDGDAGDQYIGLDRFGRVVDQRYVNSSTTTQTDRFQYGYDRNGNVLFKKNLLSSTNSELYHTNGASAGYDLLNRLTDFRRGTLSDANSDGVLDTVSTTNRTQSWALDSLGNWDGANAVKTNNTAQSRTTNAKNEVTAVGGNTLTFDNDGNTTTDETGKKFVYDAWNRLVTVKNSSNVTLSSYKYDALGRKISENPGTQTDIYYGGQSDWQDLEERQSGATKSQNVWSQTYIDDLVLRDRNADSNTGTGSLGKSSSGLEERLYVQHDANHNITAITNTSGTVQERFLYDPYGSSSVLTSAWASTTDTKSWAFRFQGGRLDSTSGFEDFRNRAYSPTLGRWVQQDPAGYVDGASLFQMLTSSPLQSNDPFGLEQQRFGGRQGTPSRPPASQSIGDKIRSTLYDRIASLATGIGFAVNWLSNGKINIGDSKGEMNVLVGVQMKNFYVDLVDRHKDEIKNEWTTIRTKGWEDAIARVGQFDTGSGEVFSTEWFLGGAHAVSANGSLTVKCGENNVIMLKSVDMQWKWDDVIDANSFVQGWKNGSGTLKWAIEGTFDALLEKLGSVDFPVTVSWKDARQLEPPKPISTK